ncbi:MAG: peptidoglycan DD-metalloendopeptidase family protein [Gammaproteobacteria bacterium]|nr:peptidoglycan DD-metalloendopeptidase family protein [Gammaproteobacteria bacterium]
MFDFAKSGPKVYAHPVPGYRRERLRIVGRALLTLLILVLLILGISFLDFSAFDDDHPNPTTPLSSDPIPLIQPIPVRPSDEVVLTPGLDIGNLDTPGDALTDDLTQETQPAEPEPEPEPEPKIKGGWQEHKISSGESLSTIFNDLGLSQGLLIRIDKATPKELSLSKIKPGQTFRLKLSDQGEFEELIWVKTPVESLHITPAGDSFDFRQEIKELDKKESQTSGAIKNSLFIDGQKAGLSDGIIMKLAEVFQWDIDFALGLREGDRFSLIYDEYHLNGEKYSDGEIIAAEFVNQGKSHKAIRYEHKDGSVGYYTPEGKSLRKAFIMTPVEFTRISSGFTPQRWHPVLKKWRSHKGVDYAAPTGTPVKAAGDGKIKFSGWQGGYGRVVIVEHARNYTTVYGHLSRFAKRNEVGSLVKQGQIIGYVGQSGLATGPHLHYEIRIAGKHTDPIKVTSLPAAQGIPDREFKRFRARAEELVTQLAMASGERFAQVEKQE